jgi:hypothetical protein
MDVLNTGIVNTATSGEPRDPRAMRLFLLIFGTLSALLIVSQLVMGQLILSGQAQWIKRHQHTGYLTVVVALVYIVFSLMAIASMPRRDKV